MMYLRVIICPIFLTTEETLVHAFIKFEKARRVWFGSNLTINLNLSMNYTARDWLWHIINPTNNNTTTKVMIIAYCIWWARNKHAMERKEIPVNNIIEYANYLIAQNRSLLNPTNRYLKEQHNTTNIQVYTNVPQPKTSRNTPTTPTIRGKPAARGSKRKIKIVISKEK